MEKKFKPSPEVIEYFKTKRSTTEVRARLNEFRIEQVRIVHHINYIRVN